MPQKSETILILHNIRSAHNVGSMFRTADAAGVSEIYLTGYTPMPIDQFNRPQGDIAKTALGAEKSLPWHYTKNISVLLTRLQNKKVHLVALEQNQHSIPYTRYKRKPKQALLVGNEVRGIAAKTLQQVDTIIEIPMRGEKESLNVAVACGIALFAIIH